MQVTIPEKLIGQWIAAKAKHRARVIQRSVAALQVTKAHLEVTEKDRQDYENARQAADVAHEEVMEVEQQFGEAVVAAVEFDYPQ